MSIWSERTPPEHPAGRNVRGVFWTLEEKAIGTGYNGLEAS
jgi:hypothetical protein